MKTLILDQASHTVGYAVVDDADDTPVSFGVTGKLLGHGRTTTPTKATLVDRLNIIRADIISLLVAYKPDEIVVESTLFKSGGRTSAQVTAAIFQLVRELAKARGLGFYSQHPSTIKKLAAGHGNATKEEMVEAAMHLWGMGRYNIIDDNHADALCAAYVWLYQGEEVRQKAAEKAASKKRKGK